MLTITMPRRAFIIFKVVKISALLSLCLFMLHKSDYQFTGFFAGVWACLALSEGEKTFKSLRGKI